MGKLILAMVVAVGASGVANAAPEKLTKPQLDNVVAGAITGVQVNNGGNTPKGNANGVPTTFLNPAGSAPPGQNK